MGETVAFKCEKCGYTSFGFMIGRGMADIFSFSEIVLFRCADCKEYQTKHVFFNHKEFPGENNYIGVSEDGFYVVSPEMLDKGGELAIPEKKKFEIAKCKKCRSKNLERIKENSIKPCLECGGKMHDLPGDLKWD